MWGFFLTGNAPPPVDAFSLQSLLSCGERVTGAAHFVFFKMEEEDEEGGVDHNHPLYR